MLGRLRPNGPLVYPVLINEFNILLVNNYIDYKARTSEKYLGGSDLYLPNYAGFISPNLTDN